MQQARGKLAADQEVATRGLAHELADSEPV